MATQYTTTESGSVQDGKIPALTDQEHKERVRELFYSLSDEDKRLLLDCLRAQLSPEQEQELQRRLRALRSAP